ncbi:MAG: hypothetical protein K2O18_08630 [Oscillospiraceae bacterium]|nr:hypothetical protein [Oscillospiraceae bacterium]
MMKAGSLVLKLTFAGVLLIAILYFGLSLISYMMDPYKTTVSYNYVSENAVAVSGYVVRDEAALEGSGDLVYSSRSEGERVSKNGTAALIYQNAQALSDANLLRNLEDQLEQLVYAQSLAAGTQVTARLDDEVVSALVGFRETLAGGSLTAASDNAEKLRAAVLKRSYAYSGTGDLQTEIASLQEQIAQLSASADPGTTRVTAPEAGLFSSLVDGYEGVLDPEMARELTPSAYKMIAPDPEASGVCKIVYGSKWYFLTVMSSGDCKGLDTGSKIVLRFQKGLDRDIDMKVDYISPAENGQRVVLFVSEKYLNLTTLLRSQNALVIFDSYSGIRVPRSAVRVEAVPVTDADGSPVLDSNGEQKTENVTCVYSLWGVYARRKPVNVLWQEDEFILVAPDETYLAAMTSSDAQEGRRLRAGDQVITAAADLYDGKVIR